MAATTWTHLLDSTIQLFDHHFRAGDVCIVDFDRTITKAEGFLFETARWDIYARALQLHGWQPFVLTSFDGSVAQRMIDTSMETHLTFLCGGTSRFNELKRCLRRVEPERLFVLTNNTMYPYRHSKPRELCSALLRSALLLSPRKGPRGPFESLMRAGSGLSR